MVSLNNSKVIFDPIAHTYTLDGEPLQGVTGMIGSQLFPDEYANVRESVLNKAKERGKEIHTSCQAFDEFGGEPTTIEAKNYRDKCIELGLNHVASEYIVSDEQHFASPIDKVLMDADGNIVLADIKTTSKLNKLYVQWQLSIYAYFFELQNPHLKVSKLMAIWLRGIKEKFVTVSRIPKEDVMELLNCQINGRTYKMSDEISEIVDAPISKTAQKEWTETIVNKITSGEMPVLESVVKLKAICDSVTAVLKDKRVVDNVISELESGSAKVFSNAKVEVRNVGTKYDYSVICDEDYDEMMRELELLKARIKAREETLKSRAGQENPEGGMYAAPKISSTKSYVITFSK